VSTPEVLRTPAAVEALVDGLVDDWRDLVASADWSSYFMTPDWVLSWWETLGSREDLVAVWRGPDGGVDAVVGLGRSRHRLHPRLPLEVRPWTVLGSGAAAADHVGWVVRPHRMHEVRRWLSGRLDRSPVLLGSTDPSSGVGDLLPGLEPVGRNACPRVDLGDGPLPTGSSKLRKQVRYDERRLADAGVRLTWQPPGEVEPWTLDDLLRLHSERATDQDWATTFTAERRALHLALLRRSARGRGPAAVVATQEDRVVGVLYGFRWRDTFAYYQTGWDRDLARLGLGTVLVASAMRYARDEGCRTFDFLRGNEPYKYRFGAEDRVDQTWLHAGGTSGRLLRLKHAALARREDADREEMAHAGAVRD
jgi:CelD/BcsL family acetyltransferase involved in cellulose biosynthesis